jgi:hypothetical protein
MAKLDRTQRYSRNYRLIRNEYNDAKLARRARTWSDERIYKELGIQVTKKPKPKLKELATEPKQVRYYQRKLDHFTYGRKIGLEVDDAKKYRKYSKSRIKRTKELKEVTAQKFDYENRRKRLDLWSKWSANDKLPPDLERLARQYNRAQGLDDYDKYGYVAVYYRFIENADDSRIDSLVRPDPFDKYKVLYQADVIVIA